MSPKFPAVTSDEVIKVLQKIGFRFKRQSGSSHGIYYREIDKKRTVVPIHKGKILKRKTLKSILSDSGLTIHEFIKLKK
ncbi:MAG: type II toxin-antitoxin system HicA family toxin [Candidatus Schekmanbacteria bacterium]|nr:type II toxin-antitoxin system HicA family toxin [Candidatus Schekmanbacteria bacterium]